MTDPREWHTDASISSIKTAVAKQFIEADKSVEIKTTEYFNNAFSPDMVLSWPHEKEDRHIFLRTNSNPDYLIEDIHLLGTDQAMLVPISSSQLGDESEEVNDEASSLHELQSISSQRNILIAPYRSLTSFADEGGLSSYSSLISKAVFQGGNGLIREKRAETIVHTISTGFERASETNPDEIEQAVNIAHAVLDTPRTNSITSFMQAIWVASGGTSDSFPVPVAATPHLTQSALSFLLDMEEIDDADFWARISANTDLASLLSIGFQGASANLQRFMMSAASRLRAKNCRISDLDPALEIEVSEGYRWFLTNNNLGLKINENDFAFFSGDRIRSLTVSGRLTAPAVETVVDRAVEADVRIRSLSISGSSARISYESSEAEGITDADQLAGVTSDLGDTAVVTSATVAVGSSDRLIHCNLETSTAHGQSNSLFYLSELALNAVPLIVELDAESFQSIVEIFDEEDDDEDNPESVEAESSTADSGRSTGG